MAVYSEVRCDCCGMRGPEIRGRPRATEIRREARARDWLRIELRGVWRDICPYCGRRTREDLDKHFRSAGLAGTHLDDD